MARNISDIIQSLKDNIKALNPTIDTDKGPVYNTFIAPISTEIYNEEQSIDIIKNLFTYNFGSVLSTEDADMFASNFGISRPDSLPARCKAVAYRFSRPTEDIAIERGQEISTKSGDYVFYIADSVTMFSAYANNYYNPVNRRYEITIDLESYGLGVEFELATGVINKIVDTIDGIDGVENTTKATGASVEYTNEQLVNLIRAKLKASSSDNSGSLMYRILQRFPSTIEDIRFVYSKDRELFKRATNRLAVDAYISGSEDANDTYQFISTAGGETEFILERAPVNSITSVSINGQSTVYYTFVGVDNTLYKSARGTYKVILDTPLNASDVLKIEYSYNNVIYDTQRYFDGYYAENDEPLMFSLDVLCREFYNIGLKIYLDVTAASTFDKSIIKDSVAKVVYNYVEAGLKKDYLSPKELKQDIMESVAGIQNIDVRQFYRMDTHFSDVEIVSLLKNEIGSVTTLILNVK